ncbi:hypothetical protein GYB62_02685, partial [bacterium]|nr:hypothetical protein [bacterium]
MLNVLCIGSVGQFPGALQKACAERGVGLDLVGIDAIRDASLAERLAKTRPDFVVHYFRGTAFPLLSAVGEYMSPFSSDDFWYASLCCKDAGIHYLPILPQLGTPCTAPEASLSKPLMSATELKAEIQALESVKAACLTEEGITAIESGWLFDERLDAVLGGLVSDLLQQRSVYVASNVSGAPTPSDHF